MDQQTDMCGWSLEDRWGLVLSGETEQVSGGAREPGGGVWIYLASM